MWCKKILALCLVLVMCIPAFSGMNASGETNKEEITVMVLPDLENWHYRIPIIVDAGDYIDIIAIDHYPNTWTVTGANDWGPLDSLINICNNYGKKGAIMETGFSTWASEDTPSWVLENYWHTEDDQEIFINTALPIIKDKVSNQNVNNPNNKIVLACWYELRGSEPYASGPLGIYTPYEAYVGAILYAEDNFGILRDNWVLKKGYNDLQNQIDTFYSS